MKLPKETFFNLPEDKRALIEDVAIDEFAKHSYDKASVNRIIKGAGIAKGSFYQYFEDKADLFKHLMQLAVQAKLKYMSPIMMQPEKLDFFEMLREMYISGLKFAENHPRLVDIGNRLLQEKDKPIYRQVMGDNMSSAYDIIGGMIRQSIQKGELRPDVDVQFTSYMISELNVALVEYYRKFERPSDDLHQAFEDDMMVLVDKFIETIKFGISFRKE